MPPRLDPPGAGRAEWLAPTGLILLSLVPVLAGSMRLTELAGDGTVTPENARFFDSPVPVVVHIVASSVFLILGALQFAPSLRRRRWHRSPAACSCLGLCRRCRRCG